MLDIIVYTFKQVIHIYLTEIFPIYIPVINNELNFVDKLKWINRGELSTIKCLIK
jgi:hypothetical protein